MVRYDSSRPSRIFRLICAPSLTNWKEEKSRVTNKESKFSILAPLLIQRKHFSIYRRKIISHNIGRIVNKAHIARCNLVVLYAHSVLFRPFILVVQPSSGAIKEQLTQLISKGLLFLSALQTCYISLYSHRTLYLIHKERAGA